MRIKTLITIVLAGISLPAMTQPVPDTDFKIDIMKIAYSQGAGPNVLIDEGHNNLHKKEAGLLVLSKLLEMDGYNVKSNTGDITAEVLSQTDIYVIANALHESNVGNWVVPNPSAFEKSEIRVLNNWVKSGGSLLLVADHMPYGGAAAELGKSFGIKWNNGFAIKPGQHWPPSQFKLADGTLKKSKVTAGDQPFENISTIASFTGSVFKAPEGAEVFMEFDDSHRIYIPDTAWQFNESTKTLNSKGFQQGALFNYGKGKVVVLGEAAMITAQVVNNNFKVGINSPQAPENQQLALNIFHYLSGHETYINPIEKIENLHQRMEQSFREGKMLEVAAFYSDDAVVLGPNGSDFKGREAINNYWLSVKGLEVDWDLNIQSYRWINDECHVIGTSKLTYKRDGRPLEADSRFYLIWKEMNNSYKITTDFYHGYTH